jgi:hypothetical protein
MRRVMVDIETLSTREDAACIAIGAVTSDSPGVDHFFEVYMDIGLVPGHRDSRTLAFWAAQDPIVRDKVFGGKSLPVDACKAFSNWYKLVRADEIWANPPQFDLVILRNLFRQNDLEVPWHHTEERDFRTLRHLARIKGIDYQSAYEGIVKHNPLSDARCQALATEIIFNKL